MAYTNRALVEASLGRELDENERTMLPMWIYSASQHIDSELETTFETIGEETRNFIGGKEYISIDPVRASGSPSPAITLQNVSIDGTVTDIAASEYTLLPEDQDVKLWVRFDYYSPKYYREIAVTGDFSVSDHVPLDVQQLATYLVSKYAEREVKGQVVQENIEGYSRQYAIYATKDSFMDEPARIIMDSLKKRFKRMKV